MARPAKPPVVPEQLLPTQDLDQRVAEALQQTELRRVGSHAGMRTYLSDLWDHREFAMTVPMGQLQARNQDKVLGRAWYLLNPMILVGIYYLIFQVILGIEERRGVENYLPFLTVGVIAYTYTRSTVQFGSNSLVKSRRLVQSLSFPRTILPLGSAIAQTATYVWALAAMLVLVLPMGVRPGWSWLLLAPTLVVHGMLNLGLALFAARFTFHFADFSNLLPFMLRLGLYVSGVLIPINADLITNDALRRTMQLNPIYNIIEMTRQSVLGTPLVARTWLLGTLWAILLLAGGSVYFRRAEARYSGV